VAILVRLIQIAGKRSGRKSLFTLVFSIGCGGIVSYVPVKLYGGHWQR